jgi:hypothetical protein
VAVVLAALAGCSSHPARDRAAVERPPALLSAGVLDLPADCAAVPGAVYRAEYSVGDGGAVDSVAKVDGPPCVQEALSRWVSTFRYVPGSAPETATLDWMLTVARKE